MSSRCIKVQMNKIFRGDAHSSSVIHDEGVGPAVVGRVGVGIIAEPGQHGGDDRHVPQHIWGDLTHPLG